MLPKVLCFLAITALVAAAPYSYGQEAEQLQEELEDDKYVDTTEDYGTIDNMQQQFEDADQKNWELKETEQYQPTADKPKEDIEQSDYREDIEQIDDGDNIEQTDEKEDIEQNNEREDIEQVQHGMGEDIQDIEQDSQATENNPEEIEQVEQTDNDWNQQQEMKDNDGDDRIHFQENMDDLESESALGKLFGESTVQQQESKYGYDQDQQQVQQEVKYDEEKLPVEEEVLIPNYNSNYESGYPGVYHPSDPFEPEVYTKKPPWYKRVWGSTKEKARHFAHKVKETFGRK